LSAIVAASFHGQETVAVQACEDDETLVIRLEKEYEDVGKKLTRFLREKKEWEDAKERLKIELAEIKARIKEIDHRITD
jgi:chromosome segregation ATPase